MKIIQILILVSVTALLTSCAATLPPSELISARSAYEQASHGPAAQLVPAELHIASQALARAENSFKENDDSIGTRNLAYVAQRKAELAVALATAAADRAIKAKADSAFEKKQAQLVKDGKQDLIESEKRASDALAELAKLAAIREEERGLVLTLSGNILFESAESVLMSSARDKLDKVTHALLAVRDRNLIVEGHTDSQGTQTYNQGLSQRRADAVRDYIVRGGYPSGHIRSHGMGMGSPIADNKSAEGRANNRRVEIIIERASHASNL